MIYKIEKMKSYRKVNMVDEAWKNELPLNELVAELAQTLIF